MKLVGAHPQPRLTGLDTLPGTSNYFIGNDPRKWRTGIPNFRMVRYKDVYPGIDLVYYGKRDMLEYDFVVRRGGRPSSIAMQVRGVRRITQARNGDLTLRMSDKDIRLRAPHIYQDVRGVRHAVSGGYVLQAHNLVRFRIGKYDVNRPLVIDPRLSYSTYLGGSITDSAFGIAVDSSGYAYVTGYTGSLDFPTTSGALQSTPPGSDDVFVSKLNASGSALMYSTYLGGSVDDLGIAIAVDSTGAAYITGFTASSDFPTTSGAFQTVGGIFNNGGLSDAFVSKLNASGSALVYSTYLGGSDTDYAEAIALDASGSAYVTGQTQSTDFPTTPSAFQTTLTSSAHAFVTKFDPTGSSLVYSTYLGGTTSEEGTAISVDSSGDAYVTGSTLSADFPVTPGAFQTNGGVDSNGLMVANAFVTKFVPDGSSLVYSSFLGGGGFPGTEGTAIALDSAGDAFLTGYTGSPDFPGASGGVQSSLGGGVDAFAAEVNPSGSTLTYSTYLGGTGNDSGYGIAVDSTGAIYVVGGTTSSDFPTTTGAFQTSFSGAGQLACAEFPYDKSNFVESLVCGDAYMAKLIPGSPTLAFSTYLGGSNDDVGLAIAVDSSGSAYIAGGTASSNFPVTSGAFQTSLKAASLQTNGFVAKISNFTSSSVSVFPLSLDFGSQLVGSISSPKQVTLTNNSGSVLNISSISITGTNSGNFGQTNTCGASLAVGSTCAIDITFAPTTAGTSTASLTVADSDPSSPQTVGLSGTGATASITLSPTSLTFPNQPVNTTSTAQMVTLANVGINTLTISGITTDGDFSQTNDCTASLAANASCTVSVTFTPTTSGTLTGVLSFTDNATGSPQTVSLTGTGTTAGTASPALTLSANQLNFGFVIAQGSPLPSGTPTTTKSQPVIITNTGSATLTFASNGFAFSGADPGDFVLDSTQANSCTAGASLAPNGNCILYIVFSPVGTSNRTATLTVASNDPAGPKSVSLAGIGMNVFYQFGETLTPPEPGVPQCFDLVSSSIGWPGSGCSVPPTGDTTNEGYESGKYACGLTSTATALSTFSAYANMTPAGLDSNPPITTYTGDTDPEKGLYSPSGSGLMNWPVVPEFLEECTVSSTGIVSGCSSATAGETLDAYLTQHISQPIQTGQDPDRVILQLCEKWLGSCPSGNVHYVTVVGPTGSNDWYLFDPGWQTTSTDSPNIYTLSGHEQGFTVGGSLRSFTVTGIKTYSGAASVNSLEIQAQSPVELLVTDSQGRQVGNISPGVDLAQIPQSSYARDFPIGDDTGGTTAVGDPTAVKTVFISGALGGSYTVTATGTGSGSYTLLIRAVASDGSVQESTISGTATTGSVSQYQLSYSSNPGSPISVTPLPSANISRNALSFGNVLVGSTSQAQNIMVSNNGVGTLSISGIGTSAGFSQTNNCGTSLVADANCTINVTFTPTAAGTRTGTLTITDNATGSPQTVALSGTGEDFSVGVASGASSTATVTAGSTASYSLSVAPEGGFNQSVSIACSGAPALATCTASPSSVTLGGTNPAAVTITVSTTAATAVPPGPSSEPRLPNDEIFIVGLGLLLLAMLFILTRPRRRAWVGLALALALVGMSAACGGGAQSTGGGVTHSPGTPAGTYTLTITGSDGSLTHSTSVTLTVQ